MTNRDKDFVDATEMLATEIGDGIGVHPDTPAEAVVDATDDIFAAQDNLDRETLHEYVCEVCETTVSLTEYDAYHSGWDYPPFMAIWTVVSPRTCGQCGIADTAYWAIITGTPPDQLSDKHKATIKRIVAETGY